jgi:hypothetical protein
MFSKIFCVSNKLSHFVTKDKKNFDFFQQNLLKTLGRNFFRYLSTKPSNKFRSKFFRFLSTKPSENFSSKFFHFLSTKPSNNFRSNDHHVDSLHGRGGSPWRPNRDHQQRKTGKAISNK